MLTAGTMHCFAHFPALVARLKAAKGAKQGQAETLAGFADLASTDSSLPTLIEG